MSVYKSMRGDSTVQFVETARQLAVHTRKCCLKMPKRYTFYGAQELSALADTVYNEVKKANSIFPGNQHEVQLRRDHLIEANATLQALIGQLGIMADLLKQNPEKLKWLDNALANECLDNFDPVGYGLGSQISQTAALTLPNRLDHVIKEELAIKGYARYMDDGYLIHHDKEHLKHCLVRMKEVCQSLGIILNTKKTKIVPLSRGFKFLQVRFTLTETGKVLRKMSFESIRKMRRKLKKFKRWVLEGRTVRINGRYVLRKFLLSDVCKAYESFRGHMKRGNSFRAVQRMDEYFRKLYGFHPNNKAKWREALCT